MLKDRGENGKRRGCGAWVYDTGWLDWMAGWAGWLVLESWSGVADWCLSGPINLKKIL